jgi:dTMP kinase
VQSTHGFIPRLPGKFLVFEGPDGSGKTTQYRRLVTLCRDHDVPVCEVREPGGTSVGERVRTILLDHAHQDMSMRCEMLLYMASRAQLVEQRIRPALAQRSVVLADRFVSSTLAYQGAAGGLPTEEIHAVAKVATGGLKPDLVVIFDVDERTAASRMQPLLAPGRAALDRIESRSEEFHRKVRQGYLEQAAADPSMHAIIDASKSPDDVWSQLLSTLSKRLA